MARTRDDFTAKTKDILAKRVGFYCSNPSCRTLTCGPRSETNKFVSIGVAAHISAASQNGPRYDSNLSSESRYSPENGIWLCQTCSKLIDNDIKKYTSELLISWKSDAERFAANKISVRGKIIDTPQLLEQLSTFARVGFEYVLPYDPEIHGTSETYIKEAIQVIYNLIGCAYLQTVTFLKRDRFVFALSLLFDMKKDHIIFYGELITHLTPFGYYFGLCAEMLTNRQIDDIIDYINSFPTIIISRQAALGKFIPYKISRINPTKIRMECNVERFIFEKGLVTTSDLLTFLAKSTHGGVLVVDDLNDVDSFNKIMKLHDKIINGFDLTEVSIDVNDPEKWEVNEY